MKQTHAAFASVVTSPVIQRAGKPRVRGITMVIDKGLGVRATRDWLQLTAPYVDLVKLGFGTALLYSDGDLQSKIQLVKEHGVLVYPGGTLLELAVFQGNGLRFVDRVAELGFTALEVSEGTIDLDQSTRRRLIERGRALGLVVLSEVGKKDSTRELNVVAASDAVKRDLDAGSSWVIVEGRDSGRGVGVYDGQGAIRWEEAEELLRRVGDVDRLIWEAPTTTQQNAWLLRLGPNANFGNVQPADVISLEATRQALRGDTLKSYVEEGESVAFCRNV